LLTDGREPLPSLPTRLVLSAIVLVAVAPARADDSPTRLADAAEQGAFNVGPARAAATKANDPTAGDVVRLDYSTPPGSAAGVWAKAFPRDLNAETVDVIRIGIRAETADQARQVTAAVEIKGSTGVQRIPVAVGTDWEYRELFVDWSAVGRLTEVVVSISPRAGPTDGTVYVDARFERLPPLRRLSTTPTSRLGGVVALAIIGAAIAGLVWLARRRHDRSAWETPTRPLPIAHDFVRGVGVVAIAALAMAVYHIGGLGRLEVGWTSLALALAGTAVAWWLKRGLTGRHLTPGEVFVNLLATGLPAASASPLAIFQVPASWSDALRLSQAGAAGIVLAYHVANFCRLSAAGRHLDPTAAALLIGTPYAIGSLLLLRTDTLVRDLAIGLADGQAAVLVGKVLVVFAFNELVANGLALATRRTLLRPAAAHVSLLAVAVLVVLAPWVAAAGSSDRVASLPGVRRMFAAVVTAAASQAGLWAEVYLVTGLALDALRGRPPSADSIPQYPIDGAKKAAVFAGAFMAIVHVPGLLWQVDTLRAIAEDQPIVFAVLAGALSFPLVKAVIETFDGSQRFLARVAASYRNPVLYARGAIVGLGLGYAVAVALPHEPTGTRAWFGLALGAVAYAGVNLIRDAVLAGSGRGERRPLRAFVLEALLGGFVGAAVGFYFDAAQVTVVGEKFHRYLAAGISPELFGVQPFLSKWGFIDLGATTGGVSLLFAEALAGVIEWSIPAWLFALNRTFLEAWFQRDIWPIRSLFTRDGLVRVTELTLVVFRWGLWMSPIIKSFLRPTGDPTWYNQDGAIRTVVATYESATSSPEAFRSWSLDLYVRLLAYDGVRVAIWLDHFGLRVATLVNLSFLGMDRLDDRLARSVGPAATTRFIPEGVKRFTTWAPLLIPFYIPREAEWNYAWDQSQAIIHASQQPDAAGRFLARPPTEQALWILGGVVGSTALFAGFRALRRRCGPPPRYDGVVANRVHEVTVTQEGAVVSHCPPTGYDVSRRSYDLLDPAGRAIFLVETNNGRTRAWPVLGNYPIDVGPALRVVQGDRTVTVETEVNALRSTIDVTLPADHDAAELWTVTVENRSDARRTVGVVPYLEWVLNKPGADRGHTQYNRLFAEVEFLSELHAVLAWDKHSKACGFLAAETASDGFLSVRCDFVGRGRSLWSPRVLETLAFAKAEDAAPHATFDPIGSLLVWLDVPPRGSARARFLVGFARDRKRAATIVSRYLAVPAGDVSPLLRDRAAVHPIGHGEVPSGAPRPYHEFSADGRRLVIHTPYTPRPWDHTMSNALGHVVTVTNRGLHTSCNVNAQQNRLTPDWPDTVNREVPGEAIYLYDPDANEWYSPTYQPLVSGGVVSGEREAMSLPTHHSTLTTHQAEFGADGTAIFRMRRGDVETELTVFVPPDDPAGVYLLTIRNRGESSRRLRVAPYFQMVLGEQAESAGPLAIRHDSDLNALFFTNPRNRYRRGPAFVAVSVPIDRVETRRGRFFGAGRGVARPVLVERGEPDATARVDNRPIAAFVSTVEVPARSEATVVVVLGQTGDRPRAEQVVRKYRDPEPARAALDETRRWWLGRLDAVRVRTASPAFDRYTDWLKYQALAERLWARRGFYQASGAFGFRDQLQDAVNLLWADPRLARRQIVLHAAQQFIEGDVAHWFHTLEDGRTALVGRTYASDTLVWLPWAVVEYLTATGDEAILDERAPYLEAEQPLPPLPGGKGGMGFEPLRSARTDTVYRHCLKAIDLVLNKRMGRHGLPLMLCGDWNDGLDEIGSEGKGESVWLGLFLLYVLDRFAVVVGQREGPERETQYRERAVRLRDALETTWREDRYLRAIHDDGTEIGRAGTGVWEIDALTAAWAVIAGLEPERCRVGFDTAVRLLEQETTILLGRPPLRKDTKPYLGRSSWYPEGVRENGMYCHGVQWLVGAARILADRFEREGKADEARHYRNTAYRLWLKTSAIPHTTPEEIETYGGQPNKQAADLVTTFDPGRMIWNGYTGAAGWMFRQAIEGVLGYRLDRGTVIDPIGLAPDGLGPVEVIRK
jgi:cyclic beta-1,2-glucan synthetase